MQINENTRNNTVEAKSVKSRGLGILRFPKALSLIAVLGLVGCGGSDSDSGPNNRAPTANAGADLTVEELSAVVLNGGNSSDPDSGDSLTYNWVQTGGNSLTINNANQAQASFNAPDVIFGSPQQFTFQITVTDNDGLSDTDFVTYTVVEPGPQVTISGVVEYEFVPANNNCQGLAFPSTRPKPIRGATVQIINANTNVVMDSVVSDELGNYSLITDSQTAVFIRVRAELKRAGTPAWDVEVRDNTTFDDVGGSRTPLAERPLYVLDTENFNSGIVDGVQDVLAETGWGGSSYTETRAAAPFAVLDVIYDSMSLILSADPDAQFPPLDAFWSVNNSSTQGTGTFNDNLDSGEIGGSFYSSIRNQNSGALIHARLFLLGMEDDDTEEFDDHVIAHEWGHYFEDNFSRSDSIGGTHILGERLDMRVAFGEGFATALSGMSTESPVYCDTQDQDPSPIQISGFGFNMENQGFGPDGWFNEITVSNMLYDLWDSDESDESSGSMDIDSLGFTPIFNVMVNEQASTEAFTSVFSFMSELKTNNSVDSAFIDGLLSENQITTSIDIWGTNETNDSEDSFTPENVLPVYTTLIPDGSVVNVCSNSQYDDARDGNKLSERQFLRFDIFSSGNYEFSVVNSAPSEFPPPGFDCRAAGMSGSSDAHRYSDPDYFVYQNGAVVAGGEECNANLEPVGTFSLSPGEHVMSVTEYRFADSDTVGTFPERSCFDIRVTPVP